eukprot:3292606-Prymnesium_polylepis.1
MQERYAALQTYLRATHGVKNERSYAVDKKQAPTRLYCHESAQSQPRLVRNVLLAENTDDYDIASAQLVMERYICACLNECAPCLEEYVKDPDAKREALSMCMGISPKAAKRLFIKCLFDQRPVTKVKVDGTWRTITDPYFKAFDQEQKQLQRRLMLRPELEWALNFAREDKGNKEGSFMAFLLQWLEGHCLLAAMRVAERFGLSIVALIFD